MRAGTGEANRPAARVRVELLALFRAKAGTGRLDLELVRRAPGGGDGPGALTVLDAIRALEQRVEPSGVGALDGDRLRRGVLLFRRTPGEPMQRVVEPGQAALRDGETLVLATAMEGG